MRSPKANLRIFILLFALNVHSIAAANSVSTCSENDCDLYAKENGRIVVPLDHPLRPFGCIQHKYTNKVYFNSYVDGIDHQNFVAVCISPPVGICWSEEYGGTSYKKTISVGINACADIWTTNAGVCTDHSGEPTASNNVCVAACIDKDGRNLGKVWILGENLRCGDYDGTTWLGNDKDDKPTETLHPTAAPSTPTTPKTCIWHPDLDWDWEEDVYGWSCFGFAEGSTEANVEMEQYECNTACGKTVYPIDNTNLNLPWFLRPVGCYKKDTECRFYTEGSGMGPVRNSNDVEIFEGFEHLCKVIYIQNKTWIDYEIRGGQHKQSCPAGTSGTPWSPSAMSLLEKKDGFPDQLAFDTGQAAGGACGAGTYSKITGSQDVPNVAVCEECPADYYSSCQNCHSMCVSINGAFLLPTSEEYNDNVGEGSCDFGTDVREFRRSWRDAGRHNPQFQEEDLSRGQCG